MSVRAERLTEGWRKSDHGPGEQLSTETPALGARGGDYSSEIRGSLSTPNCRGQGVSGLWPGTLAAVGGELSAVKEMRMLIGRQGGARPYQHGVGEAGKHQLDRGGSKVVVSGDRQVHRVGVLALSMSATVETAYAVGDP